MHPIHPQPVCIPITSPAIDPPPKALSTNGKLYGSSQKAIIFSNMDTNCQSDWDPVVADLFSSDYMLLTYDYLEQKEDQSEILEDAISFVRTKGARKIILIGASRGGVASIKVAAYPLINECIAGIAAISAPIKYEGTIFYSSDQLSKIKMPKVLINSENDGWADDTREMYDIFDEPKEVLFYPGDAHGTELFVQNGEALVRKLNDFIISVFSN